MFAASSADGTVRLWEVASASTLLTVVDAGCAINKIILVEQLPSEWYIAAETTTSNDSRQVETAGKAVIYACEDGRVGVSAVATGQKVFFIV
jgi:hypothetical protein